jgi:hypothetical protein
VIATSRDDDHGGDTLYGMPMFIDEIMFLNSPKLL